MFTPNSTWKILVAQIWKIVIFSQSQNGLLQQVTVRMKYSQSGSGLFKARKRHIIALPLKNEKHAMKMTLASHNLKQRDRHGITSENVKRKKVNAGDRSCVMLARAALARWWRQTGKCLIPVSDLPQTHNPNTLLHYISRCRPGVEFLKSQRNKLKTLIDLEGGDGEAFAALGTVEESLGNLTEAGQHLKQALTEDPDNKEFRWHLHKVERQVQVKQQQDKMLKELAGRKLELKPVKQVRRVSASNLSMQEFFYTYAATSTPVVITDLVDKMTSVPWTLQHICDVAGEVKVTLKKPVGWSVEWAGLEEGDTVTVGEYMDQTLNPRDTERQGKEGLPSMQYLFDWSLPLHCPKLVEELSIPRYFAGDLLQRTNRSSLYQDSWPSLFLAPAGVCSQLHIDAFASNFWMALFQGRKRWTFFSREDEASLYPQYFHSMDPTFDVSVTLPDLKAHPLMALAQPLQCDLKQGEVLFVPSGCPHYVENLEVSVAISANFVDLSNLSAVKTELEVSALVDPRAEDLLKQLEDPKFPQNMDSSIEELPWQQFKSWNPDNYHLFDITPESIAENKT
ncbi:LOW QUALITY PROTEIN: uncharacterized protein LOC124263846 [Haliotis rubra]|uniref:LOW QUALITY PROTEIN: uncharacterized protein LOC124263846 n=1 Tax=Haliotis rubra TaxID=36100 RepID=UPI001EE500FE|nr:LOW QUALITY PROTEIN: uncharacterized protein LOC124263846 [Haliotis rubra]